MYERDLGYREYVPSPPNQSMSKLTGQDVHLLESPILVHKGKLLAYVNREHMNSFNVFTVDKPYTDDAGSQKHYTLVLTVYAFRDEYAVVSEAVLTGQTGYRKYGPAIGQVFLNELKAMEAPPEARIVIEGNTTRVLLGLSQDGTFVFDEIVEPLPDEVTLLLHHEDSSRKQWIYRYRGNLYQLIRSSRYNSRSKEQLLNDATRQRLCRYAPSCDVDPSAPPTYIVVNGTVCDLQLGKIRFSVEHPYARNGFPVVIVITDDPSVQYLRTLTEVRAELAYYAGHDELLTQFKYVHPDLEGDPIPDVREGGTVMVSVKDPDDPRSALNGALGQVVAEYRLTCQVQFLGYNKFVEEFHKIDLIPIDAS